MIDLGMNQNQENVNRRNGRNENIEMNNRNGRGNETLHSKVRNDLDHFSGRGGECKEERGEEQQQHENCYNILPVRKKISNMGDTHCVVLIDSQSYSETAIDSNTSRTNSLP